MSVLTCRSLDVSVGTRTLVHDLNFEAPAGSVTAVLGRNGAGKTLTLHTLAGLRAPARGAVVLGEQGVSEWPRKALARELGILTQTNEDPFPAKVMEVVLMARFPHLKFWDWESTADIALARAALARVEIEDLAERDVTTLSGGERRRVAIASLLAQDPRVILLDEPLNHLDPHHQLHTLELLRERATAGCSVVMTLHDAGMAARFSDRALLLFGDGHWLSGPTDEVVNASTISKLYGTTVRELTWEGGRTFVSVS